MRITDELREWWVHKFPVMDSELHQDFMAIAGRIDAEHERAAVGCIHYDPERHYCAVHGDTENGWVRLPVDADGEYIRIGDVMEWCDNGETLTVEGIGNDVLFYIDGENAEWTAARNKRHHHEPTVEDVLREFSCVLMGKREFDGDVTEAIAEYAAKLRLAGEDA